MRFINDVIAKNATIPLIPRYVGCWQTIYNLGTSKKGEFGTKHNCMYVHTYLRAPEPCDDPMYDPIMLKGIRRALAGRAASHIFINV